MTLPCYPVYKNSNVTWLPSIPEHWSYLRFKHVFCESGERSEDGSEELLSVSSYTGVKPKSDSVEEGDHLSRAESLEGYKVCHPNELVMNIMLAWNRGLAFSDYHGIVSPAYCVFKIIKESCPRYLNYLVRSDEFIKYFKAFSSGVIDSRLRLYPETFGWLYSIFPPVAEQTQIARFLDYEVGKIDALIAEQEKLIALLKEKRQAVISHTVTKGLNPDVSMKDSGVEWLGQVPEHWVVGALKWYATIRGGIALGKSYESKATVSVPYLRVANVQAGYVDLADVKEIEVLPEELEKYSLKHGEVLMNEGGDNDKLGRGTVWRCEIEPCIHQNHVFAITPNSKLMADWLALSSQSDAARAYFYVNSKQSTNLASISSSNVMGFVLPIPPTNEQEAILNWCAETLGKFDELVNEAESAKALLSERRSALISAAVTGKIDVRGWQPPAAQ